MTLAIKHMGFRKYYIDVVEGRNRGIRACLLKAVLVLPMLFYWPTVSIRNFLYDKGFILPQRNFRIPVISLGNLTWGGTAKTSLAIMLAQILSPKKVAVLSRGYASDEVALLKRSLDKYEAESFAAKNRVKILKQICSDFDIAVLDDGFQYRKIKPDVNILLINGIRPFGSGFLIPLGCLREPKSSIKRADIAVIMHAYNQKLYDYLKTIRPGIEIFSARYRVEGLTDLGGEPINKDALLRRPLASFCAIGYPEGFRDTLKEFGLKAALEFVYPDHYALDEQEFRSIEKKCSQSGIKEVVITVKDKERFKFSTQLSIYLLKVSLHIEACDSFLEAVTKRLS